MAATVRGALRRLQGAVAAPHPRQRADGSRGRAGVLQLRGLAYVAAAALPGGRLLAGHVVCLHLAPGLVFPSRFSSLLSVPLPSVFNLADLSPLAPQRGNDFGEVFDEVKYVQSQLLLVELQVSEPSIQFCPTFGQIWELVHRVFMEIIRSSEELPRVSCYRSGSSRKP